MSSRPIPGAFAVTMLALVLSCGGSGDSKTVPTQPVTQSLGVTAVSIEPVQVWNTVPGLTKSFTVAVTASSAMPSGGWPTTWKSSDPSVATVSNGVVTAVSSGSTTISATVGGVTGTASVDVLAQPGVIGITINANDGSSIFVGDSVQVEVAHTLLGTIPPGGLITTWMSSDASVLKVSQTGMVTGVAPGTATLTATSYGKTASANFTVAAKPPAPPPPVITGVTGLTLQPTVLVLAPGGVSNITAFVTATTNPPSVGLGWPVVWTSSNPATGAVPPEPSQVMELTGAAEGTSTVTASLGGFTATATVYVATPLSITVTPTAPSMPVGQTLQLVTTVPYTGPLPTPNYPVGYTSSSPLVATVNSSGLVTALGFGKTRVRANAGNKSAAIDVTVTGPGVTMNIVAPDTVKGTAVPTTGGYTLSCPFAWSAAPTGAGLVRWGKWEESVDGTTFYWTGLTGFRTPTVNAGQVAQGYGETDTGPVAATAGSVASWSLIMRFHYAINADILDYGTLGPSYAPDYYADHKFVCVP